mgnify:CR=1 FL=1
MCNWKAELKLIRLCRTNLSDFRIPRSPDDLIALLSPSFKYPGFEFLLCKNSKPYPAPAPCRSGGPGGEAPPAAGGSRPLPRYSLSGSGRGRRARFAALTESANWPQSQCIVSQWPFFNNCRLPQT